MYIIQHLIFVNANLIYTIYFWGDIIQSQKHRNKKLFAPLPQIVQLIGGPDLFCFVCNISEPFWEES